MKNVNNNNLSNETEEQTVTCPVDLGEECTNCLYCIGM